MKGARLAGRSPVAEVAPDDVAELYRLLGEMIVIWNQCEGRLRRLVVRLAGGRRPQDFALTAGASVEGLLEILATLADHTDAEIKDHLAHYGACVERLHHYQVFLTRGVDFVGCGGVIPGARVWVSRLSGQQGLRVRHERLDEAPLRALIAELAGVSAYGLALLAKLYPDEPSARARIDRWPEKPPLPDRLGKAAPVLMGEPPGQGVTLHASRGEGCPPRRLRPV